MLRESLIAAFVAALTVIPARGEDGADKRPQRCTNAQISELERQVGEVADAEKQTAAKIRLAMSKVAMENGDPKGCVHHMEAAEEAMGD